MAGPSVGVRILADLSQFSKAFTDAGTKADGAGAHIKSAMTGALNTFNQSGVLGPFGEAINGAMGAMDKLAAKGQNTGAKLMGAGGAVLGIGVGLQAVASKDQAAHQQLQQSVENTGKKYDDYADQVDKAIKHQEKFGDTSNQTQDALRILTQATNDPAKALGLLGAATDLAASKHEGLSDAANTLAKLQGGSTKVLKEFGIAAEQAGSNTKDVTKATTDAATADTNAAKAKQGLADEHARLSGKTKLTTSEQISLRDAQQKVVDTTKTATDAHKKLSGMHEVVVTSSKAAADNTQALADKLKGQGTAAADTFTGKLEALKAKVEDSAAAFGAKYGPAITAAGTAMTALGAAWEVATGLKTALTGATEAGAAADDIAAVSEWGVLAPILLVIAAVVILGVIIYELATHWKEVWGIIKAVAKEVWDWLKGAAKDAIDFVTGLWEDLLKFFERLPGRIGKIVAGMWDGIKHAFRDVINTVIDIWNSLHFTLPAVHFLGVDTAPIGIGVPHIPHLAAGGIVTSPTLALIGESGPEAVVPLGAARGPVIHIEHAAFNDPVDVDLLSKQIEFALSAGLAV